MFEQTLKQQNDIVVPKETDNPIVKLPKQKIAKLSIKIE